MKVNKRTVTILVLLLINTVVLLLVTIQDGYNSTNNTKQPTELEKVIFKNGWYRGYLKGISQKSNWVEEFQIDSLDFNDTMKTHN